MLNIDEMILQAMKSDDSVALRTCRLIKSEILKYKTAKGAKPYDEVAEINLLRKMATQREDAVKQYSEANRLDLAVDEQNELNFIKKLLPEPVSESQIQDYLLSYCIHKSWTTPDETCVKVSIPKKSMGTVIKDIKLQFPTADGKMISDIVKKNLE